MKERINSITLDLAVISLTGLTVNEVMTLLKIFFEGTLKQLFDYDPNPNDYVKLEKKLYIKIQKINESNKCFLRVRGKDLIAKLIEVNDDFPKNNPDVKVEDTDRNLVRQIRLKFKGLKVGSMGDINALSKKLKRWKKNNPNVSDDKILEAVDNYLESFNGDYRFLQRADYFIYKQNTHKEDSSRLSTYVEELQIPKENSDWGETLI